MRDFKAEIEANKEAIIGSLDNEKHKDLNAYYGDNLVAKTILVNKYLAPWESCPQDMWVRLAYAGATCEITNNLAWAQNFYSILVDYKFIPGGRINYGLGRDDINVSLSNCYILPLNDDSLDGIYNCLKEEAQTYKTGGGCGHDLSSLRPKGTPIKGTGGESCGPVGFMNLYSVSTNTVAQNNRRGANMQTILVSHPDIKDFVHVKNDVKEEHAILAELASLYPEQKEKLEKVYKKLDTNRAVYHSNISIKITDEFMNAVVADSDFDLTWGGKTYETVKAKDIWDSIITNAWEAAEPGLMFWDRMVENYNLQYKNPVICTNPCVVGDTLIAVADGRNAVTIRQLAEEGKDVPVYSTNLSTGRVEVKIGRNPRVTKKNVEVYKLTFSDDSFLIATPDHGVLCNDLNYKNLENLKPGDRLNTWRNYMPFMGEDDLTVKSVEHFGTQDVYNITVDDNHNYNVVTRVDRGICAKNCGEVPGGAYSNCLLGHINLSKFVKFAHPLPSNKGVFDYDDFVRTVKLAVRYLDNVITLNDGKHALPQQNDVARNERRIGLGVTGLGDALVMMGYRYGSPKSLSFIEDIMSVFRNTAYNYSINLAEEKGSFPWFDYEGLMQSKFVQNLKEDTKRNMVNGIRNSILLTVAPVGSGSIICESSSGLEPMFNKSYTRRVKNDDGVSFTNYEVRHPLLEKLFPNGNLPDYVVDINQVTPTERVLVQAAVQKYIDNSISQTVNLPRTATKEDVAEAYMQAWKHGCKGITVYREGTRLGVLVSNDTDLFGTSNVEEVEVKEDVQEVLSPKEEQRLVGKRPFVLSGETYKRKVDFNGNKPYNCYITVNFFPDTKKPYELLISEPHVDKEMKDIMMLEMATRCTSMMLRHGIPIKFIIEQFEKINGQYLYSLPVNIANVLRNYVEEEPKEGGVPGEQQSGLRCPMCGGKDVRMEGTCATCFSCGQYSKCA